MKTLNQIRKEKFMKEFNGEKIFCLEYDKETLKDMVCELQEKIDKCIKYCEESNLTIKSHYFSDVIKILKGEDNDRNMD